jgi:predicted GNAT family acetyltransferase
VSTAGAQVSVRDNPEELRYELVLDGEVAGELFYRLRPDAVVLVHTEVSPQVEGQGLGSRLVAGALEDVRARGLRPVAVCPFVRAYLKRHPEAGD